MTQENISQPTAQHFGRLASLPAVLFGNERRTALFYLVMLTLAELLTTAYEPRAGMVLHGFVLFALFLHASLWDQGRQRGFLLSLALAPLIRLLSLSLPLPSFPFIYWYMVVGAPLLLAAFVAARIGRINKRMLGLTIRAVPMQLLIATTGIGLGYLEYIILRPQPLIPELTLAMLWLPALILLIFTGFLEEWIFRGLMQYTAIRSFGWFGFFYVAAVFAVLHVGYHSLLDVVFVFVVAVFFGWLTLRTGSIVGVTVAHGLTNIGLFLVFPFLVTTAPLQSPSSPVVATPTHAAPPPGLLAPIPTTEATRPWVPPTATAAPSASPTAAVDPTQTLLPTLTPSLPMEETPLPQPTALLTCGTRPGWVVYVIQPGDTLFSISARAGVSMDMLIQANCLTSSRIYFGQVLYVPRPLPPPSNPTRTPLPSSTLPAVPSLTPTEVATETPLPLPTTLPTETLEPTATDAPTQAPTETLPPPPPTETSPPPPPTEVPPSSTPDKPPLPSDTPVP